jgi:hypothetical protein
MVSESRSTTSGMQSHDLELWQLARADHFAFAFAGYRSLLQV